VTLLWDRNNPWPESGRLDTPFRWEIQRDFNQAMRWFLLPSAVLGLVLIRKRPRYWVVAFQLFTLVFMSMLFFPEARYRAPYDPLLLMLALAGWLQVVRNVQGALRKRAFAKHAMLSSATLAE
jgi:hypothetical protein